MFLIHFKKRKLILKDAKGNKAKLTVEIADNSIKRAVGLMFRNSLGENEGMLFVFNGEKQRSLWMFCTKIPLEALFFDSRGKLLEIIRMEPCNSLFCPTYKSNRKARYILEVNMGFANRYNLIVKDINGYTGKT